MGGHDSQKLAPEGDTPGAATSDSLQNQHPSSKAICSGVPAPRYDDHRGGVEVRPILRRLSRLVADDRVFYRDSARSRHFYV